MADRRSIADRLLFGEMTEEERDRLYEQYLHECAVEEATRAERQRKEEDVHRQGNLYIELDRERVTYMEFVRRLGTALEAGQRLNGEISGPGRRHEVLRFGIYEPHRISMAADGGVGRFLVTHPPPAASNKLDRHGRPLGVPAMWPRTYRIRFAINVQETVTVSDALDEINHYFEDPLFTNPITELSVAIQRKAGNQQVRSVMSRVNATPGMGPVNVVGEFLGVRPPRHAGLTTHEFNGSGGIFAPRAGPLRSEERRSWVNVHPMMLEERLARDDQNRLRREERERETSMNALNGGRRTKKRTTRRRHTRRRSTVPSHIL